MGSAQSVTKIILTVTRDNTTYMMDDWFKNWCDVAEWRENQREKEEEKKIMSEGIQIVRLSGISNRDFFQVDDRDARRQEEERIKKEKEKQDEDEEEKRKQDEATRKDKEDDEQSQNLFKIHEAIARSETVTGHSMSKSV